MWDCFARSLVNIPAVDSCIVLVSHSFPRKHDLLHLPKRSAFIPKVNALKGGFDLYPHGCLSSAVPQLCKKATFQSNSSYDLSIGSLHSCNAAGATCIASRSARVSGGYHSGTARSASARQPEAPSQQGSPQENARRASEGLHQRPGAPQWCVVNIKRLVQGFLIVGRAVEVEAWMLLLVEHSRC